MIKNSDIVFLTGGLPEVAVECVLNKGLLSSIGDSKIIIGVSAGALMQLSNYFVSPDKDYPQFMYFQGLGLINKNFYIEVHYEGNDVQKNGIKKVLKEKTDTVYAIKDTGGIIIDNNMITLRGDVVTFNK